MTDPKEGIQTAADVETTEQTQADEREAQVMTGLKRAIRTGGELGRNEQYVQAVLEIERQAESIHDMAVREAEQLPAQAEKEAQQILEEARRRAQEEAHKISSDTSAQEESKRIMSDAEEKVRRMKTLAASHMDMAISYILDQVAGKE